MQECRSRQQQAASAAAASAAAAGSFEAPETPRLEAAGSSQVQAGRRRQEQVAAGSSAKCDAEA